MRATRRFATRRGTVPGHVAERRGLLTPFGQVSRAGSVTLFPQGSQARLGYAILGSGAALAGAGHGASGRQGASIVCARGRLTATAATADTAGDERRYDDACSGGG